MSIQDQLGEALKRETSGAYNSLTFGEGALRAVRAIVPIERAEKLKGLEAGRLGEELFCHIRVFNGQVLKAAGIYYVRSNEYGDVQRAAPPHQSVLLDPPPAGLKSVWEPEGVSAYLMHRLIFLGALPVPATPVEEIIADLGWEPEAAECEDDEVASGSEALDAMARGVIAMTPGLRVISDHTFELMVSGEGKVKECVRLVARYAIEHLDELEDLIREIWHAGNFCFNDFLLNEERGARAALFAQVRKDLTEHGDGHVISISARSEEFSKQILPLLLTMRNRCIGDA